MIPCLAQPSPWVTSNTCQWLISLCSPPPGQREEPSVNKHDILALVTNRKGRVLETYKDEMVKEKMCSFISLMVVGGSPRRSHNSRPAIHLMTKTWDMPHNRHTSVESPLSFTCLLFPVYLSHADNGRPILCVVR